MRRLLRDEQGQLAFEFAMLLIISTIVGFMLLIAMGQLVNQFYGRLEGEVSRPSHY
jgi:Flp pilus assembly pilin Flp